MSVTVHHGDSREVLKGIPDATFDSCVCDPPYALVSIGKRFGADNAAPAKAGKSGAYARASAGFMGKKWDTGETAFDPAFWAEVLRTMKPGAHLVAFSGTRTYHRLACAIENAGFEMRDMIAWLYGSGFPKSHDVSKGIDRANGDERPVVGDSPFASRKPNGSAGVNSVGLSSEPGLTITSAASAASAAWGGWGTALKPALEPIVLARKPLIGTVAANVLAHGTGALNIDASRIPLLTGQRPSKVEAWESGQQHCDSCACLVARTGKHSTPVTKEYTATSHVARTTSGEDATDLPGIGKTATGCSVGMTADNTGTSLSIAASGEKTSAKSQRDGKCITGTKTGVTTPSATCCYCGKPTTSRFTANTTPETKNSPPAGSRQGPIAPAKGGRWPSNVIHDGSEEVVGAFPETVSGSLTAAQQANGGFAGAVHCYGSASTGGSNEYTANSGSAARFFYSAKADAADRCGSKHPTVKPVDLMAYLVRLVTPPGGVTLDPFAGSGSTGMACLREGFDCVLIEREAEYVADIRRRIAHVSGEDAPLFSANDTPPPRTGTENLRRLRGRKIGPVGLRK